MKVRWTEQALARLTEIEKFVAQDDVNAAIKLVDRLVQRGEGLTRFPNSGRRVPEFPDTPLREVVEPRLLLAAAPNLCGLCVPLRPLRP
jgi:toxin ParE1/3/4